MMETFHRSHFHWVGVAMVVVVASVGVVVDVAVAAAREDGDRANQPDLAQVAVQWHTPAAADESNYFWDSKGYDWENQLLPPIVQLAQDHKYRSHCAPDL